MPGDLFARHQALGRRLLAAFPELDAALGWRVIDWIMREGLEAAVPADTRARLRAQTLEECAQVAEALQLPTSWWIPYRYTGGYNRAALDLAAILRTLRRVEGEVLAALPERPAS